MKALSAATQITDPYRAGVALGEQLARLQPEVVFLFSSIHVAQSDELPQGLLDVLDCQPLVVGASGDGVFSSAGVSPSGVSALALNSEGVVRWQLISVADAVAQPANAMREALAQAQAWLAGKQAPLMWLFADLRVDAGELENVLATDAEAPVMGGLAGDDNLMRGCALFAGRQVVSDRLLLLVAEGELTFSLTLAHRLAPLGRAGRVDAVDGKRVLRIEGQTAQEFASAQYGRELGESDMPTLALLEGGAEGVSCLRSVLPHFEAGGALDLYASIAVGDRVQFCRVQPQALIDELTDKVTALKQEQPLAALLVSCAGRKNALGEALNEEVTQLQRAFPQLPLAGFPSFGELAPLPIEGGGYSRTLFHNMTYVLLLIMP